ncbi:MAG: hypothetical protein PHQ75_02345 [Thermoguttaceae bacterium]|nr:hypothetical protein [Thermoguttaceae bacterium]
MKLPFLHRFIIQRIDKTLDDRLVPGPLLCLLLRLDDEAARYYRQRLDLDDRLNADLAPFLGYPQNSVREKTTEITSIEWSSDTLSGTPWRARIAAACIVFLLGLTFAFNFCVVSPFRQPASRVVVDHPKSDSQEPEHVTDGLVVTALQHRDKGVMDVAVSFLLLSETNMIAETNQILIQDEKTSNSNIDHAMQEKQTPAESVKEDIPPKDGQTVSVLCEVADSNPLTKYVMDRFIVPVFMSP